MQSSFRSKDVQASLPDDGDASRPSPMRHTGVFVRGTHTQTSGESGDLSGERNQNPEGLGLRALLLEDFETYDRDLTQPGLWVVAVHRLGNWRMSMKPGAMRKLFSAAYRGAYHAVTLASGIEVPYSTKLGRRVRFWHQGGTVISARAVGDDVVFRHNTTVGVLRSGAPEDAKPIIGHGVEVGVGAVILGNIVVGDGAIVGANAVVTRDVSPGATAVGVPAKELPPEG